MKSNDLRLIRKVEGPRGSMRLYRYARRAQIVEIVEVREGRTQVIELCRYPDDMLADLLSYASEVQAGVDAGAIQNPKPAKRPRKLRNGSDGSNRDASKMRRKAGG
jgi:hypothetical protein